MPALLNGLKDKPENLSATMLSLGHSGDRRAVEPLLAIFAKGDYRASGDAVEALGLIGGPGVEDKMLEALNRQGWTQVKACGALARVGTAKSLPALEKLASTKGYTGALDIRGSAMRAVVAIEARIHPPASNEPELAPMAILRGHTDFIWNVAFSNDGTKLASASDDKTVRVWDVTAGKALQVIPGHARQMQHALFTSDGLTLFMAGWGDGGSEVRQVDVRTGKTVGSILESDGSVDSLIASPDGKLLASAGLDRRVNIWDAITRKWVDTVPGAVALAFSADGKRLAASDADDPTNVTVWDLATRKPTVTLRGHIESVSHGAFSPDGLMLATGGDWTVRIWNAKTGAQVRSHKMTSRSSGVCFSADGRWLAAAGTDMPVKVWEAASGKQVASLRGQSAIAFHRDGLLATGSDDRTSILLWRLPSS